MRAILIAGPTASGKSGKAIELARKAGGVIVNADSMQVYRELRILTARPSPEQEAKVPHRLYGYVSASDAYSTGRWLEEASAAIRSTWKAGRVPIVVGGTGLYFRALERGIVALPKIPEVVRERWRAELVERGAAELHRELERLSPAEARRLKPGDGQRIIRALEVLEATGEPLGAHHARADHPKILDGAQVERMLLLPDRAELYRRCDARVLAMVQQGALEEVRYLLSLALDSSLPATKAIGVKPFGRHLKGEISLDEAIALTQRETRNYAKRQMTWFRNQTAAWRVEQ